MPSLCQDLKSNYDRLQTLTVEFVPRYAAVRATGDLTEIKRLKKKLEQARDALREHLLVFIVPDSLNPYREALKEAGLTDTDAGMAERQETVINIPEEIERQTAVYAACKDRDGKPVLTEWVKNIKEQQDLLYAEIAKDYENIVERIRAGMVPTVMPSRSVQEATWEVAMKQLKPMWKQDGKTGMETVNDTYLYEDGYKNDIDPLNPTGPKGKMNRAGFFKNIPDRPYIVWTKPGQNPEADTFNKAFNDQRAYYAQLVKDHPNLYHETDIIPTEYAALQTICTRAVIREYRKVQGEVATPKKVTPLDEVNISCTRFLSAGTSSFGFMPYGDFDPRSGYRQIRFATVNSVADGRAGFRPVGRS